MLQRALLDSYISIDSALMGSIGQTLKDVSMFLIAATDVEIFLRPIILNNVRALLGMRG